LPGWRTKIVRATSDWWERRAHGLMPLERRRIVYSGVMHVARRYVLALGIMLFSSGAVAEPSAIEGHRKEGERAAVAKKWATAAAQYRLALLAAEQEGAPWAQRAPLLGALGRAELSLGQNREAAEHLASALDRGEAVDAPLKARWEAGLNRAVTQIGRLYVGVNPPDATVQLDGRTVGSSRRSYVLYVEPGEHTVSVRHEDFYRGMQTVEVAQGRSRSLGFRLERVPLAPASAAPPAPRGLSTESALQGAGLGLAMLCVVLGTGFAVAGEDADNGADKIGDRMLASGLPTNACSGNEYASQCAELHGMLEKRDGLDLAAQVSFAAGGAFGAAAAIWYFWPAGAGKGPQVRPTVAGFEARMSW
jgi:hypothetical protein